jgi:putative NIF3 family GTP cyclohydrolase 1 type 2
MVTGELKEHFFNRAQEERLNLYACGHYATEVFGVCALAEELAARFGLPWEFIATQNPL